MFLLSFLARLADSRRTRAEAPAFFEMASAVCAFDGLVVLDPSIPRGPITHSTPDCILALKADPDVGRARLGTLIEDIWTGHLGDRREASLPPPPAWTFTELLDGLHRIRDGEPAGLSGEGFSRMRAMRRRVAVLEPAQRKQLAEALLQAVASPGDDPNAQGLRGQAFSVFGALGPDVAKAVPWLTTQLEETDIRWRTMLDGEGDDEAPAGISRGGPADILIRYGEEYMGSLEARMILCDVLGEVGPAAASARPLLERLAQADDPTLRYRAARALRRIR